MEELPPPTPLDLGSNDPSTYHGIEVVVAADFSGVLSELLVKGIRDVVGWVSRDEEYTLPNFGQQHRQTAATENTGTETFDTKRHNYFSIGELQSHTTVHVHH